MADTRQVLPVVTDDDYKELDPAPAVPSSQGTYPGGQLSPNPKMSPDVKEDGVRATEKSENQAPKTRPQVFKDVLVESLKSLGKIQVQSANDLVDKDGNPIVGSGSNTGANVYSGSYAEDETLYTKDMKAGDIVVDTDFDFVGIIKSLAWDGDDIDEIVLVGLEDNDLSIPVTYVYDGSEWSRNAFSGGGSGDDVLANTTFAYNQEAGSTEIKFPVGIQPLEIYLESASKAYGVNYGQDLGNIVDLDDNSVVGNIDYGENGEVVLVIDGEITETPGDDSVNYVKYDHAPQENYNDSAIRGIKEVPTQLYQHTVVLDNSTSDNSVIVTFVSTRKDVIVNNYQFNNANKIDIRFLNHTRDVYGFINQITIPSTSSNLQGICYDDRLGGATSLWAWVENDSSIPDHVVSDTVVAI